MMHTQRSFQQSFQATSQGAADGAGRADAAFTIPAPVAAALSVLPAAPGSVAFASGLNLLLAPHIPADVGEALRQRHLRVQVRDARLAFDVCWNGQAFTLYTDQANQTPDLKTPDLTIAATAADFWALARREQDPDTLFFARRLVMEGDTELGLMVKNMIDAIDLPVFDPRHWRLPAPRAVANSLWQALPLLSSAWSLLPAGPFGGKPFGPKPRGREPQP
ncbi:MAG: SCP2 sterol-binding domain-containing protein [Brachymonas sp.]|nr:SCP2 sterol-binding domain-containing protein [Brachymonas sp.]MDO4795235.1 SCP2 sterol-binding domain-containing protein [Brachymonas sp.]